LSAHGSHDRRAVNEKHWRRYDILPRDFVENNRFSPDAVFGFDNLPGERKIVLARLAFYAQ
jgi:hypothetical protein